MTPKKLAQHYLRYWNVNSDGTAVLADNAPREVWQFVLTQPSSTDRQLVYEALDIIATGKFPSAPDQSGLLRWFANFPNAVSLCDEALASKQPPKSLGALLKNAYLAEVSRVRMAVSAWLQAQIDLY